MSHWRSGTFWASLIFGWFVTTLVLAALISFFGSEEMTTAEGVIISIAHQSLSLLAGYAYGRRQFELRQRNRRGFPVITKEGGDSTY